MGGHPAEEGATQDHTGRLRFAAPLNPPRGSQASGLSLSLDTRRGSAPDSTYEAGCFAVSPAGD